MVIVQISQCILQMVLTPFLHLNFATQICVYCIQVILLIYLILQWRLEFRYDSSYVVYLVLVVIYVESEAQGNAVMAGLSITLQLSVKNRAFTSLLNLYALLRVIEYNLSNLPIIVISLSLIAILSIQKRESQKPELDMTGIGLQNDQTIKTPNEDYGKFRDSGSGEFFNYFNFIPEGFALISNSMNVKFCNQAMMNFFNLTEQQSLKECLEQLKNIMNINEKKDQKIGTREMRDSLPAFASFRQISLSGNKLTPPRRNKVTIQGMRKIQSQDTDENIIISEIMNMQTDSRFVQILKTQQSSTQHLGNYLADYYTSLDNKRLVEISLYATLIEERVTAMLQLRDVTHRDYIKLMQQSYKAKSNTISFVSHEYRTPLNLIISYLGALQEEQDPVTRYRYLQIALNNSQYLLNLSNDLLDLAQIKAGSFSINPQQFDIKQLAESCLEMFRLQAEHKKIDLMFKCTKNVPQLIYNDPNRVKQIMINLLGNAFKFTLQGYISLNISMEGSNLKIEIQDSGIGVKIDDQQNLIKAFGKVNSDESRKMNSQGVGLGLLISNSIVKCLSKEQDGLMFTSEYLSGSQFWFYVARNMGSPTSIKYTEEDDISTEQHCQRVTQYVLQTKKRGCQCVPILLVDDNSFNMDALRMMIKRIQPNVSVDCSLDGLFAVKMVEGSKKCSKCCGYKMIFMDIEMPRMNGYQATKAIKSIDQRIRIIGCSGYANPYEERLALDCGMDEYLTKPVQIERLKSILTLL